MTTPKKPPSRFAAVSQQMRQMGKAAALASMYGSGGPGSPVALMTVHLKKIVVRYRQVKLFPIKPRDFFESVYPIEMFLERTANDPRWQNLAKALNVEPVAHFHIEGRDATHETFWVKNDLPIPAPKDLSETLLYAKSNPYFDVVNHWVTEALDTHDLIDGVLEQLRGFINSAKHPTHVEKHWPQLMPFIGELPESALRHVEKISVKGLELPIKRNRDEITDLLATCSLLPDVDTLAWVKFPEHVT